MIFHVESWSNVTKEDLEELSKIDRIFLCSVLNLPKTAPKEAPYLKLGLQGIDMIVMNRRVNYFREIMTRKTKNMLQNLIMLMWNKPTKGDWTQLVKEDFRALGIDDPLNFIQNTSKTKFKRYAKESVSKLSFKRLMKQ